MEKIAQPERIIFPDVNHYSGNSVYTYGCPDEITKS